MGKRHVKFDSSGNATAVVRKQNDLIVPHDVDEFWFDALHQLEEAERKTAANSPRSAAYTEAEASKLLIRANYAFEAEQERTRNGDHLLLKNLLKKGTAADQISALVCAIQKAPVHIGAVALESLGALARKKGREQRWIALEALSDVFGGLLLPETRRLRAWDAAASESARSRLEAAAYEQWALYRAFEALLKRLYADFVSVIEETCADDVEWLRQKAMPLAKQMLALKPEAEARLLSLLVNKIGDPLKKVSTHAQRLIAALCSEHPAMRGVIVDEIERLLMRSNVGERVIRAAILALTQMRFGHDDEALARKLIGVYLRVFSSTAGDRPAKPDTQKTKTKTKPTKGALQLPHIFSSLLTGMSRAFPYAGDGDFDEHFDRLFRLARCDTNFGTAVQAMTLILQVMSSRQTLADRFYRCLYESMLSPSLLRCSKLAIYFNLLFRALKSDSSAPRVAAFVKRLLQVCLRADASFTCGALFLVSELCKTHASIYELLRRPQAKADDDDEEHFVDHDDDDEDAVKDSVELEPSVAEVYDVSKRDPSHAGAQHSCLWEVILLLKHSHPSIVKFASLIVAGEPIVYAGDPISDFTNMAFLDRFVYRNAKKVKDNTISNPAIHARSVPSLVNHESFWSKQEHEVRPDERFFHQYFRLRHQAEGGRPKPKAEINEEDEEEFAYRQFENELMKDGAGPVDIDDEDIDFGEMFGQVQGPDTTVGSADANTSGDVLDTVLQDADISDGDLDAALVDDADVDSVDEDEMAAGTKKSRFVDAEEYAELLSLTQEAAQAAKKTDAWQAGKKRKHYKRPAGSRNKRRCK